MDPAIHGSASRFSFRLFETWLASIPGEDMQAATYTSESNSKIRRALEHLLGTPERWGIGVRLWTGEVLGPSDPPCTVVLLEPGSLHRMLWPPSPRTTMDAYIRGDFEIEGDIVAAIAVRDRFSPWTIGWAAAMRLLQGTSQGNNVATGISPRLRGPLHSRARDRAAIRHHYDLGNDFYSLWLDKRMIYSCGYFADPSVSLETAQEAKLEMICRKLRLKPGDRLLDIGCGWGGLITWAAEHHGVQAMGITLSPAQAAWARERIAERGLGDRCSVRLTDYRDLPAESFDKVASVGMVEHVGEDNLADYFKKVFQLLRPGGVFLNHGISATSAPMPTLRWLVSMQSRALREYVFPDSELPSIHRVVEAAARERFELRDVESLREHYAQTLRHWVSRIEQRQGNAMRAVGERTWRLWRLYLAGSAHYFDIGALQIYQSLFVKPDDKGKSHLPLGREGWYEKPLPGAEA